MCPKQQIPDYLNKILKLKYKKATSEMAAMKLIQILWTVSLCCTAILGDYIVFKSKFSSQIFRAFADTSVHAAIGFFSSLLFFSSGINVTNQALIYNDLTNLKQRGIFHNTSFWIILTMILLTYSYTYRKLNIYILTYMLIIAFTSHHIRDANRRGLWLYPFGHTPAISTMLYIILVCVIPSILACTFNYIKPVFKHTVINFGVV